MGKIAAVAGGGWEKWRKEENAAWSTEKYALLKIDDAVYLKPGETATLAPQG